MRSIGIQNFEVAETKGVTRIIFSLGDRVSELINDEVALS